ncbi:MAG: NUDIX domain-containing protein [Candidatus Peregrinibacteria bacterium]
MSEIYRNCASIVVFRPAQGGRDFEVLLLKKPRKRDSWQLPQGGVEEDETTKEAAVRELSEEAGLEVECIGESATIFQYEFPKSFRRFRPDNVRGQRIGFIFGKTTRDVVVTVDQKEITEYQWVRPVGLSRFIRREEYLNVIRLLIREGEKLLS